MTVGCISLIAPQHAAAQGGIEGPTAIAFLNQQRAANGIPPVADNQDFAAAWCPDEDSGPTGGESGRDLSSVVTGWSPTTSPWDDAPLHQQDIYNPLFTQAGDVNAEAQACLGVGAPLGEPATPTFATFFSDTGPDGVPTTETVEHEGPFAPQQLVGIPQGTPTGGQIILYAEGMGAEVRAISWTLTEADGNPVPNVRLVDDIQATNAGYSGYLSGVGVVIPPALKALTVYNLSVLWEGPEAVTANQMASFKTTAATNRLRIYANGNYLYGESAARGGVLTVSRSRESFHTSISTRTKSGEYRGRVPFSRLGPGHWQVCVSSGGGSTGYRAERRCMHIAIWRD